MSILSWVGAGLTAIGAAIMWAAGHLEGQKVGSEQTDSMYKNAKLSVFNKDKEGPGMIVMLHKPGTEFDVEDPERGLTYGDIRKHNEEHPEDLLDAYAFDEIRYTECNEDDD